MEREWSIEEVIEALRQWEDMFYSESETKNLMNKAADYLEKQRSEIEERTTEAAGYAELLIKNNLI